mmetsp:Transcript_18743/g.17875  ORF Transcript_18743/g.17875 Transcript_18743/m.17875 type:complete len:119 (-) Transcript_18743:292-648(-)
MQGRMGELTKIDPLIDQVSGVKIYHYAFTNLYHNTILTRNYEGNPSWFKMVQSEIYYYYSQLASSVLPSLSAEGSIEAFDDDIMEYIEANLNPNKLDKFNNKHYWKERKWVKVWESGV